MLGGHSMSRRYEQAREAQPTDLIHCQRAEQAEQGERAEQAAGYLQAATTV